jgi:pyruvate ferredoxin oxidoreductase delta subunit
MDHPWYKKRPLSASIPAGMSESKTFSGRTQRPVIDHDACTRCGLCFIYCPEGIIERGEKYTIRYDYCHGCGLCAVECPRDAISMVEED